MCCAALLCSLCSASGEPAAVSRWALTCTAAASWLVAQPLPSRSCMRTAAMPTLDGTRAGTLCTTLSSARALPATTSSRTVITLVSVPAPAEATNADMLCNFAVSGAAKPGDGACCATKLNVPASGAV